MFSVQEIDQVATSGRSKSRKWPTKPNHGIGAPTSWKKLHGASLTHFQRKITKRTSQSQGWPRNLSLEPIGPLCEGSLKPLVRMVSNLTNGHQLSGWSMKLQYGSRNSLCFVLWFIAYPVGRPKWTILGQIANRSEPGPEIQYSPTNIT
ncbi:unnamed protein product [Microthlaspi erraticum]|uniref:Uncharacterized protein n=1 Tax=Microthlaspi erraticum TaxID=1685480 RepID=A0A6D2HXL1_9BRAS|nr:unnamed protein product [Microthlaspi erraticum]